MKQTTEARRLICRLAVPYLLILLGLYSPYSEPYPTHVISSLYKIELLLFSYTVAYHLVHISPAVFGFLLLWNRFSVHLISVANIFLLVVSFLLTIFVDAFSGTLDDAGAALKYLHHLTLVLLFMTLNSKLRVVASGNRLPPILSSTGKSILLNIGLMGFAIWSIVTFGALSVSAVSLADGKPYCIAKPNTAPFPAKFYGQGTQEFFGQIESLIWLRGRNLATTASGHKVAEDKGFFALLTVRDGNYDKFWKWSFRSMAWKPALPDQWNQLIVRSWGGCLPINDFLSKQPIFSTASLFKLD